MNYVHLTYRQPLNKPDGSLGVVVTDRLTSSKVPAEMSPNT